MKMIKNVTLDTLDYFMLAMAIITLCLLAYPFDLQTVGVFGLGFGFGGYINMRIVETKFITFINNLEDKTEKQDG